MVLRNWAQLEHTKQQLPGRGANATHPARKPPGSNPHTWPCIAWSSPGRPWASHRGDLPHGQQQTGSSQRNAQLWGGTDSTGRSPAAATPCGANPAWSRPGSWSSCKPGCSSFPVWAPGPPSPQIYLQQAAKTSQRSRWGRAAGWGVNLLAKRRHERETT